MTTTKNIIETNDKIIIEDDEKSNHEIKLKHLIESKLQSAKDSSFIKKPVQPTYSNAKIESKRDKISKLIRQNELNRCFSTETFIPIYMSPTKSNIGPSEASQQKDKDNQNYDSYRKKRYEAAISTVNSKLATRGVSPARENPMNISTKGKNNSKKVFYDFKNMYTLKNFKPTNVRTQDDIEIARNEPKFYNNMMNFQKRINEILKTMRQVEKKDMVLHTQEEEKAFIEEINKKLFENSVDSNKIPLKLPVSVTLIDKEGKKRHITHEMKTDQLQAKLVAKYRRELLNKEYDTKVIAKKIVDEYNELITKIKTQGFKIYTPAGLRAALQDYNDFYRPRKPEEEEEADFAHSPRLEEFIDTNINQDVEGMMDFIENETNNDLTTSEQERIITARSINSARLSIKTKSPIIRQTPENNSNESGNENEVLDRVPDNVSEDEKDDDSYYNQWKSSPRAKWRIDELLKENSVLDNVHKYKTVYHDYPKPKIDESFKFQNETDKEIYMKIITWQTELEYELKQEEKVMVRLYVDHDDQVVVDSDQFSNV